MAANAYKAYVDFDPSDLDEADPTDVATTSVVCENAMLLAESAGQSRIKMVDCALNVTLATFFPNTWYELFSGYIDAHLHPESGAFRFRVRLAGHAASGNLATFRVGIGHDGLLDEQLLYATLPTNVAEYSRSGLTSPWLTPHALLVVNPGEVAAAVVDQETVASVGGATTSARVCRLAVRVLGKIDSVIGNANPTLTGLSIEEYVG